MRKGNRQGNPPVAAGLSLALLLALSFPAAGVADPAGKIGKTAGSGFPVSFESGLRYWYSGAESSKDLYDSTGALLVSRLTYQGISAHSGELFFRADLDGPPFFLKGFVGAGVIGDGALIDEDFPPTVVPYSRTWSSQEGGGLTYAGIDLGYDFLRRPTYRIGAFLGYHFMNETVHAFGCSQQATSTICAPSIPASTAVISQDNDWHSLRLGLTGRIALNDRLSLSGDAAYLFTTLDGEDRHHLRPQILPLPEDGTGQGVQLEAMLNYRLNDRFSLGVGGRYWLLTSNGQAHFEATPARGSAQVEDWKSERYGLFVQGSITLD